MKRINTRVRVIFITIIILFLTQPYAHAQNATSEARVEFVAGTGPTYPVHPEEPEIDGNDGEVNGSLAIVTVSQFDFGAIPVKSTTWQYDVITTMPNIQVVDLRGTGAGWKVLASVSRFTDGNVDTLPGASILITDGRPNSLSSSDEPKQKKDAVLMPAETPELIISAGNEAGTGLWVMRWYESGDETKYVKLEIPAGSAVLGNHTATINWILEDTP